MAEPKLQSLTTTQLVRQCLDGDQPSMREFVDRFRHPVFGLCLRMLGHWEDAEDATQETFVRALRHLGRCDLSRPTEPWLFAIAGNRCRTMLATRSRRPANSSLASDPSDTRPCPSSRNQLVEEIDLGLAQLRIEYQQVFLLFHQHQLSYDEIAAALDRPVGTIKTWVHRARGELLSFLANREREEVHHALP